MFHLNKLRFFSLILILTLWNDVKEFYSKFLGFLTLDYDKNLKGNFVMFY